jgi:chromosome segregation ATPase
MSSTLFGRGTNTQVGLARRAEEVKKSISDIRAAVESVQELPTEFRVMRTRMEAVETYSATIATLTKLVEAQQKTITVVEAQLSKIATIDSLAERISKLEAQDNTRAEDLKTMEEEIDTASTRVKTCETITEAQTVKITKLNSRVVALEKAAAEAAAAAASIAE